ncbi:unnamed protein product [Vitrella brassicaformis CCMP3155]|uniref:Uncharacterized protein n=1 Tax=Vitrella brassicaformis (strain CCMP3155) TaxID=1169540 RepID=A0A0G4EW53_VITBC|nr:unnamed protein product [Vitrella brassicaformis CCMP3155]|eukprot:CEM02682.1 unnamed protein product [Vitrella brassicaformis CCMP3155]
MLCCLPPCVKGLCGEGAGGRQANRALQADVLEMQANQIRFDRLTETFAQLTTADELIGFAMQLADRQTALSTEQSQLQSLERRAWHAAQQKLEAELRQQMQHEVENRSRAARDKATACQVCDETERRVVLHPCVCQGCEGGAAAVPFVSAGRPSLDGPTPYSRD